VEYVQREQIAKGRNVAIRFYGGEPMLELARLKDVAARIQAAAVQAGVTFSCSLVSNGTLLTLRIVEELLPFGLESAQLTLDGPQELHDRQRPFISGNGSFSAILANIKETYELVSLKLGGNFTAENYREFPLMLDALLEAGIDPSRLAPVQFAPVLPKSGTSIGHDDSRVCLADSTPWLLDAHLFLREETLKRGFSVLKPVTGVCMIELENDLIVNYDGSLYKCPALMGWPELSVGTLTDGIGDYSAHHNLDVWKNDECLECAYLPLCFGGCRLHTMLKNGAIDGVDCRRAMYDAALETIVRQDLKSRYQAPVL
jgi:uncharacterized protein